MLTFLTPFRKKTSLKSTFCALLLAFSAPTNSLQAIFLAEDIVAMQDNITTLQTSVTQVAEQWPLLKETVETIVEHCLPMRPSLRTSQNANGQTLVTRFAVMLQQNQHNTEDLHWASFLANSDSTHSWGTTYRRANTVSAANTLEQHRLFLQLLDVQELLFVDQKPTLEALHSAVQEAIEVNDNSTQGVVSRLFRCMVTHQLPSIVNALRTQNIGQDGNHYAAATPFAAANDGVTPAELAQIQDMIQARHGTSFAQRPAAEDEELQRALRMSALWTQQQAHTQGLGGSQPNASFAKPEHASWAPAPGKEDEVMTTVIESSVALQKKQARYDENDEAIMRIVKQMSQQMDQPEPVAPDPSLEHDPENHS
ncbi:MAG: hypothetical protein ACPG7U_01245 [Holosporaceae bacterium]